MTASEEEEAKGERKVSRVMSSWEIREGRKGICMGDCLRHPKVAMYAAHDVRRAQAASHDASAERGEREGAEIGQGEHRDEHGGYAVQRGAALTHHCTQGERWVEARSRWENESGGVGHTRKRAKHEAKAVVEGHGYADPICVAQPLLECGGARII